MGGRGSSRLSVPRQFLPKLKQLARPGVALRLGVNTQDWLGATASQHQPGAVLGDKFHAIITDAVMPLMDGNALAQTVKSDPQLKDLPIIMITASKEANLIKKSFSSGCVLFLPKPFTASSLLSLVQLVVK